MAHLQETERWRMGLGATWTARCSGCGVVIKRITEANAAGIRYARVAAERAFAGHECAKEAPDG